MSAASPFKSMNEIFDTKYDEFAKDLEATCPELATQIAASVALSSEQRREQFRACVLPSCSPKRNTTTAPEFVLPGVRMPAPLWETLSSRTKKAIQEYLTLLSFSFLLESGNAEDISGSDWTTEWATKMAKEAAEKMKGFNFAGIGAKIAEMFAPSGTGDSPFGNFPQFPEKFLKGQIAKLAEEIIKEIKIEDFGIDPSVMEAAGNDPGKALEIIMGVFTRDPTAFQATIMKLSKRLQQKIQSGAIRPQELVAEAEELMKTFSDNPQFVEMMESFRQSFGFGDQEAANAAGREPEGRLSLVRERLRKKLAAKKKNK